MGSQVAGQLVGARFTERYQVAGMRSQAGRGVQPRMSDNARPNDQAVMGSQPISQALLSLEGGLVDLVTAVGETDLTTSSPEKSFCDGRVHPPTQLLPFCDLFNRAAEERLGD